MRNTRITTAAAATLLLAGCANTTFHIPFLGHSDEKPQPGTEYAGARKDLLNQPLEVPPDLTAPHAGGEYLIPGVDLKVTEQGKKAIESGAVMPKLDRVRVEKSGDLRWLVVDAAPQAVWPQARQFWLDEGYTLSEDNALAGLLETNWLAEKNDAPQPITLQSLTLTHLTAQRRLDRFGMRLEPGSTQGTTEIYITHRGLDEAPDAHWAERADDPEAEAREMQKLLVRLGVSADVAGQTVASAAQKPVDKTGANTAALDRASVVKTADGKSVVQINESFDRAWRRVGQALERAGYTIVDRDRSLGVYYVQPTEIAQQQQKKKDSGGFWDKLAFWKSDAKKTDDEPKGPQYQVAVVTKGDVTTVSTGTRNGSALPADVSAKLIKALVTELH